MKTILIIEDDSTLRENTAEILELENYTVHTASNGKIGLEKAKTILPDVIVCDIMMPEIDGYGVIEALSKDEKTLAIPFIFLSAKNEHHDIRKGMQLGADDYLTKPFEEEDLLNAIESRLAKAALLKKNQQTEVASSSDAESDHVLNILTLHELKNYFDDYGELISIKRNKPVFLEGDHANQVYLILKGVIKTHKMDENGKELITHLYQPDEFLGLSSLTNHHPHQENATAVEDAEVSGLNKSALETILKKNPGLALDLIQLLSDNLSQVKDHLLQMAYSSVKKKTATTILQFVEIMNKRPNEPIKISRYDLASVAGIATESLIRTLSVFKKDNLIDIEGRNIKVLNQQKLREVE